MRVGKKHSQHKILLPAWLTAAHSDGCALNILHLQGHVCVKFLCKKVANTNVISHAADYTKQPDSVTISNNMDDIHRSQLTLWSIKLGFLHCKQVEKTKKKLV